MGSPLCLCRLSALCLAVLGSSSASMRGAGVWSRGAQQYMIYGCWRRRCWC
jgi:hypothetical protein